MQTCKVNGVVSVNLFYKTSIQGFMLQCYKAPLNSKATLLSTSRCKLPVQSLWDCFLKQRSPGLCLLTG